jgi:hypothetical protein
MTPPHAAHTRAYLWVVTRFEDRAFRQMGVGLEKFDLSLVRDPHISPACLATIMPYRLKPDALFFEDGVGISRVADHLMPFVDRDLAGENGRAAAVAFFEDLVEVAAGTGIERFEAPIIEDQELSPVEAAHDTGVAAVAARQRQIGEQFGIARWGGAEG